MEDTIGSRVRYWRKERGMTQEGLAHLAKLSQSTIARLERNRIDSPDFDTVSSIARVLDVETSVLLGDAPLPPAPRSETYPSLVAFLERYEEVMRINAAERAWLESQAFQLGDIGDTEWWMAQLALYRHQVKATSMARTLITSTAPPETDPRPKS